MRQREQTGNRTKDDTGCQTCSVDTPPFPDQAATGLNDEEYRQLLEKVYAAGELTTGLRDAFNEIGIFPGEDLKALDQYFAA